MALERVPLSAVKSEFANELLVSCLMLGLPGDVFEDGGVGEHFGNRQFKYRALGFGLWALGFGLWALGFWALGFRAFGFRLSASAFGFRRVDLNSVRS